MKKMMLIGCLFMCAGLFAQSGAKKASTNSKKANTGPGTAATGKPAATGSFLKNEADSFSYALGLSMANFYKEQGVTNINTNLVVKALNDSKSGKVLLSEADINSCIVGFMQKKRSEKSAGARKAGEAFLAENAKKPGVVTLPSGLQYQVLKEGTGPKPAATDNVKCHYAGSFIDGKIFESSYERNEPATFQVGGVIKGWTEALQLMNAGSKWRLFIPSALAYGDADNGPIPGGSVLIFEVELLEIVKQN